MADSVVDKIRKLLAVAAVDSGATEGERQAALDRAATLMAKYRIEQHHLDQADADARERDLGIVAEDLGSYDQRDWWRIDLAYAVGATVTVDAVFIQERLSGGRVVRNTSLIGRPESVAYTRLVWDWVIPQLYGNAQVLASAEIAYRQAMHDHTMTPDEITTYLEGYYRGAIAMIHDRLKARQRRDLGAHGTAIERSDRARLNEYYGEDRPEIIEDDRAVSRDSLVAGWRDGARVDLDPSNKVTQPARPALGA